MNELLDMFGVSSHKELLEHVTTNPTDKKVIELKELLTFMGVSIPSSVGEKNE